MKRFLWLLGCLALVLTLAGCHSPESGQIRFYYCRDPEQYQYFEEDGVIRAEDRELLSHRGDLQYLMGLYLAGPLEEGLRSPFPQNTSLLSIRKQKDAVFVELSDLGGMLTDAEFTLACCCLTLTCLDAAQCDTVTITSGSRSVTMNADSILLFDGLTPQETTEVQP